MKVRELLTDESKWTRMAMARTPNGEECPYYDSEASCFCLLGAIQRCYYSSSDGELRKIYGRIEAEIGYIPIILWNDRPNRTFAEVKALVEKLDI